MEKMIHSAVSTLPQPINPHTPSNKASDGREPTQTHSNASKKDIDGENATASTLFAIEEGSGSRPQSESRRVASRVKRIAPAPTTKFHWEGAGSSFTSVGSSFVSAASQSSVYQYVDDDIGNVEEEEKSSAETVRARRRPNHSIRNSFRRSIHDTLLDDNERTAFTTTLTKSEFLAEIMNGFLDDVPDKSSDGHLAS